MTDPLADALEAARTGIRVNEDGSTSVYLNDGAHLAQAAREHIAAEIESAVQPHSGQPTPTRFPECPRCFHNEGILEAARIARRGTDE